MANSKSNPTIKDVAAHAGVSIGTVSKVINNKPVGASYKEKVLASINALGYRVNSYAQGLRSEKTYTVAVIIPHLRNPFYASLVQALSDELAKKNYDLLLCASDYDPEREQSYVTKAENKMVDGIICLSYNQDLKTSERTPFVSIDRYFGHSKPCVASDNYAGGRLAAEVLHKGGASNLAFLRIGSDLKNEPDKRKDGFVSYCEENNLNYEIKFSGDETPYSDFEKFLKSHYKNNKLAFDGIFCVTDSLAYKVIQSIEAMGLKVPEDVQVMGFDGVRKFGDYEYVCSTIVQPVEEIAKASVKILLDKDNDFVPSLINLPVEYAYGNTTNLKSI